MFNKIGYYEDNKRMVCCDAKSVGKKCEQPYKLILPEDKELAEIMNEFENTKISYKLVDFQYLCYFRLISCRGKADKISLHYPIPIDGKYYIVIGLCNPQTTNLQLQGSITSMNSYGHLPARMNGLLPCIRYCLLVETILCIVWLYRVCMFYKHLLSIHAMITLIMLFFTFSTFISYAHYSTLNTTGSVNSFLQVISLFTTTLSQTFLRCLLLIISMGLGISVASLGSSFWTVLLLCGGYFLLSVIHQSITGNITIHFDDQSSMNMMIVPLVLIDVCIYMLIVKSLFSTIEDLRKMKQTSKLEVFVTLRTLLILFIILSTIYNGVFSYLLLEDALQSLWRIHWVFTDGVWMVVYIVIMITVMVRLFTFLPL